MGHGARNLGARLGFGIPGDVEGLAGRTVVAAMVGGLSSRLTGGSFANGALTATFVHMFNAENALSKSDARLAAKALDERKGYWVGVKEGLLSITKGFSKSVGYGSSYWASKACSAWSSECAATHQLIRNEGGNIGLAAYDILHSNWPDTDNASMIMSESTTAGGYVGGRAIGLTTASKLLSGGSAGIGAGIFGLLVGGNMLSASEMYGENLSSSQLVNSVMLYEQ